MHGMNNGLDPNDPTVVAAFQSALPHQGLIAMLIFGHSGSGTIDAPVTGPGTP